MNALNYATVMASVVAVFVFAAAYYTVMAGPAARLSAAWAEPSRPSASLMALELGRSLAVALAVAGLVSLIGISDPAGAILLALALWGAFPVVLLVGSVIHEKVPWKLAAIHAGDWLAKLLIISVIVTVWR